MPINSSSFICFPFYSRISFFVSTFNLSISFFLSFIPAPTQTALKVTITSLFVPTSFLLSFIPLTRPFLLSSTSESFIHIRLPYHYNAHSPASRFPLCSSFRVPSLFIPSSPLLHHTHSFKHCSLVFVSQYTPIHLRASITFLFPLAHPRPLLPFTFLAHAYQNLVSFWLHSPAHLLNHS